MTEGGSVTLLSSDLHNKSDYAKVSLGWGVVQWAGTDVVTYVQVLGVLLQSNCVSLLCPLKPTEFKIQPWGTLNHLHKLSSHNIRQGKLNPTQMHGTEFSLSEKL